MVSVVENPVINQVAFEGNHKAKDEQLKAEVQSKPRGTLSKPTVQADVQRIIEIYHRSGRFDVTVVPQIIELPNNRVNLVFEINEGPKTGGQGDPVCRRESLLAMAACRDVIKTTESNWLSFLQTTDIYDPDRVEADRDLLRRFYLKHGYADVRIVSPRSAHMIRPRRASSSPSPSTRAPNIISAASTLISNVHALNPAILRSKLKVSSGDVYNADLVQKSVEGMTIEAAKHGYAFAAVHPRGDRDFKKHLINIAFVVDEGVRAYIERINIRGNTRTRDYVIRREFDIGEGDPYNRALIDRAERRLKNLDFFKSVKITTEPGSAPDRVVVDVDVVEKSTGEFSVSGGYSTADGFIAEVGIAERNLMGRGQFAKASVSYGQYTKGFQLSFVEPYLLGYRMAGGIDLYARQNLANSYVSYDTQSVGTNLRLGFGLTEELSLQTRYSIYQQKIQPAGSVQQLSIFEQCARAVNGGPGVNPTNESNGSDTTVNFPYGCYTDGEASLAVRKELAQGAVLISSVGYTIAYNTLDNVKVPTSGLYADLKQDFAGVGGDVNYHPHHRRGAHLLRGAAGRRRRAQSAGRQHRPLGRQRPAHARPLLHGSQSGARLPARRHRSARL